MSHAFKKVPKQEPDLFYSPVAAVKMMGDDWSYASAGTLGNVKIETRMAMRGTTQDTMERVIMRLCEQGIWSRV